MVPHFVLETRVSTDLHLVEGVKVRLLRAGIELLLLAAGLRVLVPTLQKPVPGRKVFTAASLTAPELEPFIARREPGGGGFNAGLALARHFRTHDVTAQIFLVNSACETPELLVRSGEYGIQAHSLRRQPAACSLIVPHAQNRVIVKECAESAPASLGDHDRAVLRPLAERATAVASCSSRDLALSAALFAHANGATRWFQATGSLGQDYTLLMLEGATMQFDANFDELKNVARELRLLVPSVSENSPRAPRLAAKLLLQLHRLKHANGRRAAVTLGGPGSVIADWEREQVHWIQLRILDGTNGVPTRAGAGDQFMGILMGLLETWAKETPLKDPVLECAIRTTHIVAELQGLAPDRYEVAWTTWRCAELG